MDEMENRGGVAILYNSNDRVLTVSRNSSMEYFSESGVQSGGPASS